MWAGGREELGGRAGVRNRAGGGAVLFTSMLQRIWHRLKFELEGFLLRGPLNRLLFIAMAIGALSVIGGLLVYFYSNQFNDQSTAVWWAFLRLSDPGYLGDDEGTFVRTISTILTVLGYVVFLGALVAIMTQWLNQTLTRLQSGLTPIAEVNHIVILGWSGRVVTVVQELLLSEERVEQFLRARREGELRIAILAEDVDPQLLQELRDQLGKLFDPRQIILRSGTPLRIEHLRRVDYQHAAAILLPRPEVRAGASDPDERTLKVLLSISAEHHDDDEELPLLVAEMGDARKVSIAQRAYRGPIEVIATDRIFGRLVVQTLRSPGLSGVFGELLTHRTGTEIYVRAVPDLAGLPWIEAVVRFPEAIPLGVVRRSDRSRSILLPDDDFRLEPGDRIAVVAQTWADAAPGAVSRGTDPLVPITATLPPVPKPGRILIIGWNEKVSAVLSELSSLGREQPVPVDVVSRRSVPQRLELLEDSGADLSGLECRQLQMSATVPVDLIRIDPASYDHVVLLASDRFDGEDESDARTIVASLVLEEAVRDAGRRPHVVVELLDPDNEPLLRGPEREILVSPLLLGHVMTQVALRPELSTVFDELFGTAGTAIEFHPLTVFGLEPGRLAYSEVAHATRRHGAILLGWRNGGGVQLNPARSSSVDLRADSMLIVVRSYE